MYLLLFGLLVAALSIVSLSVFREENNRCIFLVIILVASYVMTIIGTETECRDGWASPSIGQQGACSWHGGVVLRYTEFGESVIGIAVLIVIGKGIHMWYKEKQKKSP